MPDLPLKFPMLPYQASAWEKLKDAQYGMLLWTMGKGKTKTTIDLITHKVLSGQIDRVLVIAPNYVQTQWVTEELPKHFPLEYDAMVYRKLSSQKLKAEFASFAAQKRQTLVLAVHIDAFATQAIDDVIVKFCKGYNVLAVLDEATRIKNPKAKRTQRLMAMRKLFAQRIALTGTALSQNATGVWSICRWVHPSILPESYAAFKARYTLQTMQRVISNTRGPMTVPVLMSSARWSKIKAEINCAPSPLPACTAQAIAGAHHCSVFAVTAIEKQDKYCGSVDIDHLKERLAPYAHFIAPEQDTVLPEKIYMERKLALPPLYKTLLADLARNSVVQYKDIVLPVKQAMLLQSRALQICGGFIADGDGGAQPLEGPNPKMEELLSILDEIGEAQFLVFAAHTAEIQLITAMLDATGFAVQALYGGTAREERDKIVTTFKAGHTRGLVCNAAVAGYGLNLQGAGYQIWYSRNFRTEDREQAEGRSHRHGIEKSPVYIDLLYDCKVERSALDINRNKISVNEYFTKSTVSEIFKD